MPEANRAYLKIKTGVRHGCILSLFPVVVDFNMKKILDWINEGIYWTAGIKNPIDNTEKSRPKQRMNGMFLYYGYRNHSFKCNALKLWVHSKYCR